MELVLYFTNPLFYTKNMGFKKRKKAKRSNAQILFWIFLILNAVLYTFLLVNLFFPVSNVLEFDNKQHKIIAKRIYNECKANRLIETCYSRKFGNLTEKSNLKNARIILEALQDIDPVNARGCHLIAHSISIAETRKDPNKWQDILATVDSSSCTGGFVHGVFEVHQATDPKFKITADTIPEICKLLPDTDSGGDINCSHNLGHLLLVQEENNIENSVQICNKLDKKIIKYECLSGVFMERMTRLNLKAHGLAKTIPWTPENTQVMEEICIKQSDTALIACWRELSHMIAVANRNQPEIVFKACNRAQNPDAARECYHHASSIIAVAHESLNIELNKICSVYVISDPLFDTCMSQTITGMLLSSVKFSDAVAKMCDRTDITYMESCYKHMGKSISIIVQSKEERTEICHDVPDKFRKFCTQSIL